MPSDGGVFVELREACLIFDELFVKMKILICKLHKKLFNELKENIRKMWKRLFTDYVICSAVVGNFLENSQITVLSNDSFVVCKLKLQQF